MTEEAFKGYRSTDVLEMRPIIIGESLKHIYVSPAYIEAGSPKPGDMIARNPTKPEEQWLVTAEYFRENFEPLTDAKPMDDVESDEPTALDVLFGIVSGLMLSFSVDEIRLAVDEISELGEEHWEAFKKYQSIVVAPQWDHLERRLKRSPPKREH